MDVRARGPAPLLLSSLAFAAGCAGSYEPAARSDLAEVRRARAETDAGQRPDFDGSLNGYVAYAMARSPELEASFERWRASVLRIAPRRRPPEPVISYAYFVRSVETRVGPQQHRLSVMQSIPWPTRLTAGADAQAAAARAQQERFEAQALALAERVATAYWRLWLIHREHQLLLEQEAVLEALVEAVRARVEVGEATLADLGQIEVRLERMRDHREAHRLAREAARARLIALVGAPPGTEAPVADAPPAVELPAADEEVLLADALDHPRIAALEHMAEASVAQADAESAAALPTFGVGANWTIVGEGGAPMAQDNGKDAVMVSVSVSLPIWFGSYTDAEEAARAEAMAFRAEGESAEQAAAAELAEALASVRDSYRRVHLYRDTLLPQAETVYRSALGAYQTGGARITDVLLAVGELLDLQLEVQRDLARHATAWARLQHVVGHDVEHREPEEPADE